MIKRYLRYCGQSLWPMLIAVSALFGETQPGELAIGETKIALGMSADRAVAALRGHFEVDAASENPIHQWFVITQEKPQEMVGVICVKQNAVVGIEHLIFSQSLRSTEDMFGALYDAASRLSENKRNACELSTWTKYDPIGVRIAGVHIHCGVYGLRLVRDQYKSDNDNLSGTGYSLWEDLGNTK